MMFGWLALGFFLITGCGDTSVAEPPASPAAPASSAAPAPPAAPATPAVEAPVHPVEGNARMAASHILISYVGAMSAAPTVVRGREDAKVLAEKLRARAAAGEDFSALAKEFSADPSKSRGGSVGNFDKGTMVGPFETATEALAVGEISPVVESPFGFHIIRRDMMSQIHCAQIVVGFAGSARPIEGVTRSKEQAAVRAAAARADLDAGVPWEVLVRKYTDGPGKDDQGDLGWFSRRQLMPVLDEAAFALAPGETSAVVESAVGFHLLHRLK